MDLLIEKEKWLDNTFNNRKTTVRYTTVSACDVDELYQKMDELEFEDWDQIGNIEHFEIGSVSYFLAYYGKVVYV